MTDQLDALREARTYREIVAHLHPGELGLLTRDEANAVITLARSALAAPSTEPTGAGRRDRCPVCGTPGRVVSSDEGTAHFEVADSRQSEGLRCDFDCDACRAGADE